jgi:hypothetical protein
MLASTVSQDATTSVAFTLSMGVRTTLFGNVLINAKGDCGGARSMEGDV